MTSPTASNNITGVVKAFRAGDYISPYARDTVGKGRISQPDWFTPATAQGLGFLPRRGIGSTDAARLRSLDQIVAMAQVQPLNLLILLPDIVPEVGKAVWNTLRLGCGEGAVTLTAMERANGVDSMESAEATQIVRDLFSNMPDEIGTLEDILAANFLMLLFSGMCANEAVPGPRMSGIKEIWPIDTLTLLFRRGNNGQLNLYQRQRVYNVTQAQPLPSPFGGYIALPMERTFWTSLDNFPDDPYGRTPYAPVLAEVLSMLSFMKDLLLAWHRVGTPRYDIGFDFEMWSTIARDVLGLTDQKEIQDFVQTQYNTVVNTFQQLRADDAFFHDIKSKVQITGSGAQWPDVQGIYNILRWRMIMALKEMPTLMGVVEGNTETWSTVDWQIYSQGLKTLVAKAARPIIRAAQLHLRLLGRTETVVAEYAPIRANQRLADAQAEQLEIDNAARKRDEGWQTQDSSSTEITGSAAVGEPDREALGQKMPSQTKTQSDS